MLCHAILFFFSRVLGTSNSAQLRWSCTVPPEFQSATTPDGPGRLACGQRLFPPSWPPSLASSSPLSHPMFCRNPNPLERRALAGTTASWCPAFVPLACNQRLSSSYHHAISDLPSSCAPDCTKAAPTLAKVRQWLAEKRLLSECVPSFCCLSSSHLVPQAPGIPDGFRRRGARHTRGTVFPI